jgi:hypothetical protein
MRLSDEARFEHGKAVVIGLCSASADRAGRSASMRLRRSEEGRVLTCLTLGKELVFILDVVGVGY